MDVDTAPLSMRVAAAATATAAAATPLPVASSSSSSSSASEIDVALARRAISDITSAPPAYRKTDAAVPYAYPLAIPMSQLISGYCDGARASAAKPEHSTRLRAPSAHEFECDTATSILSYFAATMHELLAADAEAPLLPPPDFVTTEHVRAVLCAPYGELQRCAMGEWCIGRRLLGGGTILMGYVSPRELRNYQLSGVLPKLQVEKRPCYLCLLLTANTCVHLAENAEVPIKHVRLPFAHIVDAPGGYRRSAVHSAPGSGGSVCTALRTFCTDDYRPLKRRVSQPLINATTREVSWRDAEVLGYEEDASLLHGANADPAATGVCPMPPCEDLLAAEVLRGVKLGVFGADVSRATRLYGPAVPTQFELCEDPARLRESLALCSFELGCVRLDYALRTQGDTALRALAPRTWRPPFAQVEDETYVGSHRILTLLFLKFDVLTALLSSSSSSSASASSLDSAGTSRKCAALLDALKPMLDFFVARHLAKRPLADADMLTPDPATDWAPFAQLYPAPAPVYFSAADVLRHAANKLTCAAPAVAPYLCNSVSLLYTMRDDGPQILRDALRARHVVCADTLQPTIDWLAQRSDRHAVAQLAAFVPELRFVNAALLPGVTLAQLYSSSEYTPLLCRQVNERLRACLATGSPTMSVWTALVLRAAVLAEMLRAEEDAAALTDSDEQYTAFVCGSAASAVADAFNAAVERDGVVDVLQDVVPHFVRAGAQCPMWRVPAEDGAAARIRALHLALGAHARACARLLLYCAAENSEVDVMACVGDLRPSCSRVSALLRLVRAPPAALAALANAHPSAAVHTAGLVADVRAACASDANFRVVFAAMTAATLCGEYAHSRASLPPFGELVQLQVCMLADGGASYALTRDPATLAVVARDFALALLHSCPARLMFRATRLTNVSGWARAVSQSAAALRLSSSDSAAAAAAAWPPESARMQKATAATATLHGDFLAAMAKLFRQVDIEVISWTAIARGQPVADAELAMPERFISVLADYVRALPLYQGFRVEWLARAGIDRRLVTILSGLTGTRPSVEVVREMAYLEPVHYAIVSMFFRLCVLQKAWSVHRLDSMTALRQLRAVLARDGALIPQTHYCGLTRTTCCNRFCDIVVQRNPMHTGVSEVRTALDINTVLCRRRQKKPPADRTAKGTEAAARVAIARYHHVLADLATQTGAFSEKEVRDRKAAARDEMRHEVSQYAGVQHKKLCQTQCGAPLHFVPLIGAVVEHAAAQPQQQQQTQTLQQQQSRPKTQNCTLCPSCGSKTRFSLAMIGPNAFTCGLCDADVRRAVVAARRGDDVCCVCGDTRAGLAQQAACCMSAAGNVYRARLRPIVVADDCTAPGAVRRSVTHVCTLCYSRWIVEAAAGHITLSQVRVLKRLTLDAMTCMDELVHSSYDVDMRARLVAALRASQQQQQQIRPATLLYPERATSQWTGVAEGIVQRKTAAMLLNSQMSARITASRRRVRTERERAESRKRVRSSAAADKEKEKDTDKEAENEADDDLPQQQLLEEFESDSDGADDS